MTQRTPYVVTGGLLVAAALLSAVLLETGCASGNMTAGSASLGWVTRGVFAEPENLAFRDRYDTVSVATGFLGLIRQSWGNADAIVFFGTWCPDSRREVPHFLKIADSAGVPEGRIRLYAVDRSKKGPDDLTDKYGIDRVPTFIMLRDGREVGRIVEYPRTTLEGDLLAILAAGSDVPSSSRHTSLRP
jgi:thiol-disulfide isomerase/thioredoxin